jgi:predicted amidophosphoribosyltransferase
MTRLCCPSCRLRFPPAASSYLIACPDCSQPLQSTDGLESIVGLRLFEPNGLPASFPEAIAVSLPVPEPGAG